jgi:hypothetical protein
MEIAFKNVRLDRKEFKCLNEKCNQFNTDRDSNCDWANLDFFIKGNRLCDYYCPSNKIQEIWKIIYD